MEITGKTLFFNFENKRMERIFRRAVDADVVVIWKILQDAISRRKADGSRQWQDGYPNIAVLKNDLSKKAGYVFQVGSEIAGYIAVMVNDEPEYKNIEGQWLTDGDFVVFHRLAVADRFLGTGVAKELFQQVENFARHQKIKSIKADTNFDNLPMIHLFENLGYQYCGQVYFRGSARKAFEKVLY